jgi:hypothetical protein
VFNFYWVFSVDGATLDVLKEYIKNQDRQKYLNRRLHPPLKCGGFTLQFE